MQKHIKSVPPRSPLQHEIQPDRDEVLGRLSWSTQPSAPNLSQRILSSSHSMTIPRLQRQVGSDHHPHSLSSTSYYPYRQHSQPPPTLMPLGSKTYSFFNDTAQSIRDDNETSLHPQPRQSIDKDFGVEIHDVDDSVGDEEWTVSADHNQNHQIEHEGNQMTHLSSSNPLKILKTKLSMTPPDKLFSQEDIIRILKPLYKSQSLDRELQSIKQQNHSLHAELRQMKDLLLQLSKK